MNKRTKLIFIAFILAVLIASFLWGCTSRYAADNGRNSHTKAGGKRFCMSQRMQGY